MPLIELSGLACANSGNSAQINKVRPLTKCNASEYSLATNQIQQVHDIVNDLFLSDKDGEDI